MSGRRGFTLVEVLVTMFLVAIGITVLVMALVPSLRVTMRGHQRIELQQSGNLALRLLMDDLSHSAAAGIKREPTWLSIHRLREISATGTQVWEDRLVVYRWEGEELLRSVWRPAGLVPERPLQPAALVAGELTETRVVARGVEAFSIGSASPVQVKLGLHRGENRLFQERWLYLRNSSR